MRCETSSVSGGINGFFSSSTRGRSARALFAATRSRSDVAAIPASWSPDFSSFALAKSSLRSANWNRSLIGKVVCLENKDSARLDGFAASGLPLAFVADAIDLETVARRQVVILLPDL